ncbi:hypothetical protein ACIRST_38345 [Kitasatospora sp. NPDC101447]|uniref:hypothetical protein n=1 Tax=Kitasatospora sp. NPDC101447 TaxID=3364102 RepID=UPI00380A07BE
MHDPRPEDGPGEIPGELAAADPWERAERAVRAVVGWYTWGIHDLCRSAVEGAGPAALDVMMAARRQAAADLQRLKDGVDAGEAAHLAAYYVAVMRELTEG